MSATIIPLTEGDCRALEANPDRDTLTVLLERASCARNVSSCSTVSTIPMQRKMQTKRKMRKGEADIPGIGAVPALDPDCQSDEEMEESDDNKPEVNVTKRTRTTDWRAFHQHRGGEPRWLPMPPGIRQVKHHQEPHEHLSTRVYHNHPKNTIILEEDPTVLPSPHASLTQSLRDEPADNRHTFRHVSPDAISSGEISMLPPSSHADTVSSAADLLAGFTLRHGATGHGTNVPSQCHARERSRRSSGSSMTNTS